MKANGETPLDGLLVVERAGRLAGSACAGLLLQLGARVIRCEAPDDPQPLKLRGEAAANLGAFIGAGRERVVYDPGLFRGLLERADIAVVAPFGAPDSEDVEEVRARRERLIGCVITPYGLEGPAPGMPEGGGELFLQAVSGIMATTGEEGGCPLPNGVPLAELLGGVNAASAALAALYHKEGGHAGQVADIAMFDGLIGLLGTFMPLVIAGANSGFRMGCRHPMTSPWNVYPTSDSSVIICISHNDHWERLMRLAGREDVLSDKRFATPRTRRAHVDEVDRVVSDWTRTLTTQRVNDLVEQAGAPVGTALSIAELLRDEGFVARGMVRHVKDEQGRKCVLPGPVVNFSRASSAFADAVSPLRQSIDTAELPPPAGAAKGAAGNVRGALPLAGIKVIELGIFTAGPTAVRHLTSLGARTVKIEPPHGDPSRAWEPVFDGMGHYFTNTNCDKSSLGLDLKHEEGKRIFFQLVREADLVVENMRPGTLDNLGMGYEELRKVNPGIILFSLSGYGQHGPLARKAAYDTVIQAGTGIFGLIGKDVPVKLGVSIADMMGAQFAPLAILAALRMRRKHGFGQRIDISMQDSTAWLTQLSWPNSTSCLPDWHVLTADGGYVIVEAAPEEVARHITDEQAKGKTASQVLEILGKAGLGALRVLELDEVLAGEQVARRRLLPERPNRHGTPVKVLECPLRLEETPGHVREMIGEQGEDNQAILAALGYSAREIESFLADGVIHY